MKGRTAFPHPDCMLFWAGNLKTVFAPASVVEQREERESMGEPDVSSGVWGMSEHRACLFPGSLW